MPHSELRPEDLIAVIDTREQKPWPLTPLKVQKGTLTTGDYSIVGLEREIAVERKSLPDLLQCIGRHRKRFLEEIERLHAYPSKCVIIECSFYEFQQGNWILGWGGAGGAARSRVSPAAAMGSVLSWMAQGIPFLFCQTPEMASITAARFMFVAAKRRYKQLAGFYGSLVLKS